jgi:MFS family permease
MSGMLRVRRSRGAMSGALLMLLGAWGAIVAFIGPTFGYAYTPASAWSFTSGRFWLELLPGIAALLGGLLVLVSAYRPVTLFGAWLAAVGGAWFVVGAVVAPTWINARITAGVPVGSPTMRALEEIGFFIGLGVVIVFLAATALGRLSVIAIGDRRRRKPAAEARAASAAAATPSAPDTAPWTNLRNKLVASRRGDGATKDSAAQDERTTARR